MDAQSAGGKRSTRPGLVCGPVFDLPGRFGTAGLRAAFKALALRIVGPIVPCRTRTQTRILAGGKHAGAHEKKSEEG